jgi:hypothetical protein
MQQLTKHEDNIIKSVIENINAVKAVHPMAELLTQTTGPQKREKLMPMMKANKYMIL